MGATKNIQNVRQVDATNSDNRQGINASGQAAIQNPPNLDVAASTLATQATLAALDAKLATIDAVLDAIKDTAGVKKITDALPAGTNIIGGTRLYDHNGNALTVQDGVALPAGNDHLLVGGVHNTDGKTYHARVIDDTDTAALKRLLVEAAIKPGSTISTTPAPANLNQAISSFCKNGSSKDMNVDGSTTAVEFTYDAHGTKDIWLHEVRFILNCDALPMKGEDFGSDITLTNGVKFEVRSNSITTELANFTINEDFLALPARSAITTIYDGPAGDQLIASFYFGGAVTLVGGSGDFVKVTVRDDIQYSSSHKTKLFWAAVYGIREE